MVRAFVAIVALVGVAACGTYTPSANGQASSARTPTPAPTNLATPWTDITPGQEAIDPVVLPPATVLPAARLCSVTMGFIKADGVYGPAFCVDGSLNDFAWAYFAGIGPHVLGAGKTPTAAQVDAGMQADISQGASDAQEYWAYTLAAAYYGWTFTPNRACAYIYKQPACQVPAPSYSNAQSRVAARVLPPATVLPVARLCSADLAATANGNWEPRFCADGSINAAAWKAYTDIGPNILAAGKSASVKQIDAALNADFARHATNVEELDSYQLAAAYYGWRFTPNPACELIYKTASCY